MSIRSCQRTERGKLKVLRNSGMKEDMAGLGKEFYLQVCFFFCCVVGGRHAQTLTFCIILFDINLTC